MQDPAVSSESRAQKSRIKIYARRSPAFTLRGHSDEIIALALLRQDVVASCAHDRSVLIWNTRTRKVLRRLACDFASAQNRLLDLLAYGARHLVTLCFDSVVRVLSVVTGDVTATRNRGRALVGKLALYAQRHLLTVSRCGEVELWDTRNDAELFALESEVLDFTVSGAQLITISPLGTLTQ